MSPSHRLQQDDMVAAQQPQRTDALALGSAAALARGTLVVRLMPRVARDLQKQMDWPAFFPPPLTSAASASTARLFASSEDGFSQRQVGGMDGSGTGPQALLGPSKPLPHGPAARGLNATISSVNSLHRSNAAFCHRQPGSSASSVERVLVNPSELVSGAPLCWSQCFVLACKPCLAQAEPTQRERIAPHPLLN